MFSTLIDANLCPIVPVDSSAANIPLPGAQISLHVYINSALKLPDACCIINFFLLVKLFKIILGNRCYLK